MALLEGKHAVITGASSGIGKACAQLFADEGAQVYTMSRNEPEFDGNVVAEHYSVDVADSDQVKAAVKALSKRTRQIDVLVNCAGVMDTAFMQMTTDESLHRQFDVNFFGTYNVTKWIARLMTRSGSGSIVNFTSMVALECTAGKSAYAASKAAVVGLSKSLAKELGGNGIRVNCIAPSIVNTPLLDGTTDEAKEEVVNRAALKRIAEPEEVAGVALFLASDLASYVSGQVIRVDGGM